MTEGKVSLGGPASAISDKEKAAGAAWQIIGYDAMDVYVHPDNKVRALSLAQLKDIFKGFSEQGCCRASCVPATAKPYTRRAVGTSRSASCVFCHPFCAFHSLHALMPY